ncbi:Hsp20/alpha crystallin family protein [Noviherbaspirillum sp.]|uniref:Hsp20/alpha crystallin family protein n=1 Tax=Noviherbaspirillum sp. TaxID=1926288 RepID=UPI002B4A8837|nr:Hsp20/alpha crystallin family protein [Noviherbaspirillum sp.]HJV80699.1 Hsp20/alpha crystallin family protein [Noviherbaspirillum sp.]
MRLEEIKQGWSSFWDSVAEGWQHLRQSASSAITGFKPSVQTNLPAKSDIDDAFFIPSMGWSMLGGDVFEDDKRLVVRIEVPGLDKNDLDIEVQGDALIVRGEKRFEREDTEGRYRVLQCAYGSFRRVVPLHAPVLADQAKASYKNGVLRVELPKMEEDKPHKRTVKVD